MRLSISLFLPALWAASYVVGKGPPGLKPGPRRCDRYCAPGVSCPANDGCFIQGRANMSAEAGDRCSSTVESVIAAEQTSCAASISAEQTSCAASISAEQTNCISAQQSSCAASISLAIASAASSVSSAQQSSCAASIQAAVASAVVGQKCGVVGASNNRYQQFLGLGLEGCKARCLVDSRCLSYSCYRWDSTGWCYLHEKVIKDLDMPTSADVRYVSYDRNCP